MQKSSKSYFEEILRIRSAQIEIAELVSQNTFDFPVHLALGHEAIAVGVINAKHDADVLLCTHRNIHYQLASGTQIKDLIEYLSISDSEENESNFLGLMNLIDSKKKIIYTSSILGNNLAVGAGYALGSKVKSSNQVTWVITGDGAIEEGIFYESLLFAKSNKLKIIFVVENNKWSLASEISERRVDIDLNLLANSMNIEFFKLNRNDTVNYVKVLTEIREGLDNNSSPVIVEVDLTTLGGYFVEEPNGPRYINYHAGSIKNLDFNSKIISESEEDPLFVILKNLESEGL
jgi:TPP-dependent pyruvate/acetoin dehydrogenase alpha subunit